MTTAQQFERRRWIALALLAMAQFVVVLEPRSSTRPADDRRVALLLGRNSSWVVNAYVLTFGGFLLLGGRLATCSRPAPRVHGRPRPLALASLAGGSPSPTASSTRRSRASGGGSSRRGALDRHDDVPRRCRAQQGARCLGRGRRVPAAPRASCWAACCTEYLGWEWVLWSTCRSIAPPRWPRR